MGFNETATLCTHKFAVVAAESEPIPFAFVKVRSTGEDVWVWDLAGDARTGNHWIPLRW